jgi:ADP-ribosylglycohydrolase
MRAPVIGLAYATRPSMIVTCARASAVVTHAHPLAQEGAILVALATSLAYAGTSQLEIYHALVSHAEQPEFRQRLQTARAWQQVPKLEPAEVRKQLGNGITAPDSCVTAIYIALRFLNSPFDELLAFTAACKGDVDTIGAMAGAIWGVRNGYEQLPAGRLERLEQANRIQDVATALYAAHSKPKAA